MKQKIGLVIVMALIVILISNIVIEKIEDNKMINSSVKGREDTGINAGELAPDITMTNLNGEEVKLSDFRGKKVILNFWATWCPPCKAEMPHMQNYYDENNKKQNVEIIGFNMTFSGDSIEKVEQFVSSYKLTFPIYTTFDKKVIEQYQVMVMPTTYFIDEEGRIQHKVDGPVDEDSLAFYIEKMSK
jgi:peroxiredoxin